MNRYVLLVYENIHACIYTYACTCIYDLRTYKQKNTAQIHMGML